MTKRLLLTLYICLGGIFLSAQETAGTIKGTVKDEKGIALEFVNVLLKKAADSSLVKAAVTNATGEFIFENIDSSEYFLVYDQLGLTHLSSEKFNSSQKNNFSDVVLKPDTKKLNEIDITAKRPFIEHAPGKTILNVENSIVSTGGTVMDVLKKAPGVIIDKDGNITFKGKSNVMIMIDGKLTYLSGEQLVNLLKSMPADQADQIELMSKPPAKYDAAGNAGIINIKLKKTKYLGFNGTVFANYAIGLYSKENGGANLNYRNEKLNIFGNYFFAHRENYDQFDIVRKFQDNGQLSSVFNQYSRMVHKNNINSFKFGMDYFISPKHTIGFAVNGFDNTGIRNTFNTTDIRNGSDVKMSSSITNTVVNDGQSNYTANLNYKWDIDSTGTVLTSDLDYATFGFKSDQDVVTNSYDSLGGPSGIPYQLHSNVPLHVDIRAAKLDFSKPIGKTVKFEAGAKSSLVVTDNDVKYYNVNNGIETIDSTKTNHFRYSENINALYADVSKKFDKFSFELGLRAEQTLADGYQVINDSSFTKKYFQVFPTVFLAYQINKNNVIDLSLNRRIDRPDYGDLNPFKEYLDPYTFQEGNPFLRPMFTNAAELCYTFMDAVSATFSYNITTDLIVEVTKQIDSTKTTYATKDNIAVLEGWNLELEFPIPIAKWWMSMNYISVNQFTYKGEFQGGELNNTATNFIFNSQNQFEFKKGFSAELEMGYHSPMAYGIFQISSEYNVSIGIQKKFFHDRGRIRLAYDNLFCTEGMNMKVKYQNMDINLVDREEKKIFRATLVYTFGKTTVKRSRQRSSAAEDELNRANKKK